MARQSVIVFGAQVLGVGLNYIVQVLLARALPLSDYGAYGFTITWVTLLGILVALGLPVAVVRFVAEYQEHQDWARMRGVLQLSWRITLGLGVACTLIGIGIVFWIDTAQEVIYAMTLIVGFWMIPFQGLLNLNQGTFRALRRIATGYVLPMVVRPTLTISGIVLFLVIGIPLNSTLAIGITALSMGLVVLCMRWLFWRQVPAELTHTAPTYETRLWLSVTLPMLLIAGSVSVKNQTDILMTGTFLGAEQVGLYFAATRISTLVNFVLVAVNAVFAPSFATLHSQGKHTELQELVTTASHWIFWPSLLIISGLTIFAEPVLSLFGPTFTTARWVLIILMIGQLVNAWAGSVGLLLNMTGYQNASATAYMGTALLNVVFNALAIPHFGIIGAAVSTAATMILVNVWLYMLVVKHLNIHASALVRVVAVRVPPS